MPTLNHILPRCALLGLLLFACHDAPRKNPFDPALTPAVELATALNDTTGTVALTWTPYAGRQPFAAYWILRKIQGIEAIDTLAVQPEVDQTTFIDSSLAPNTTYDYWIAVVNASGFAVASQQQRIPGLLAGPVQLLDAEIDAAQGIAALRWTRFVGTRFAAYRVERRGSEEDFVAIHRLDAIADTTFADENLQPEQTYFYRIVVEAAGREWISNRSNRLGFSLAPIALLSAIADRTTGSIALNWSRFSGPGFQSYRVQRRIVGTDTQVVLSEQTSQSDTSYADQSALADVDYSYTIAVLAAAQELLSNSRESRLELPASPLQELVFDSATASAALRWAPYTGPRFQAYQVLRTTTGQEPLVVAEIEDREITAFVDSSLLGNTRYFYRISIQTTRAEETVGTALDGTIHGFVDEWPLDLAAGEIVRLYIEEPGELTALIAGRERVRLLFFDLQGNLRAEQVLLQNPFADDLFFGPEWSSARQVSTARLEDGRRLLSYASARSGLLGLLEFAADGALQWREQEIFSGESFDLAAAQERFSAAADSVNGSWGISSYNPVRVDLGGGATNPHASAFSAFNVAVNGRALWQGRDFVNGDNWVFSATTDFGDNVVVKINTGALNPINLSPRSQIYSSTWESFALQTRQQIMQGGAGLGISMSPELITWSLDVATQQAILLRRYPDRPVETSEQSFAILAGVPYGLRLEASDGIFTTAVAHAHYWTGPLASDPHFASVATVEGFAVVASGDTPVIVDQEGQVEKPSPLPAAISEMRSWTRQLRSRQETWLGLCLPDQHQILYARAGANRSTGGFTWAFASPNFVDRLGRGIGQAPGEMVSPLSFAVGPDGRFYVLDAGNARIQVFDAEGQYLTQWGTEGSGAGQFDFGTGFGPQDLAGSVIVDNDGFIYVADVFNNRIQKFAP